MLRIAVVAGGIWCALLAAIVPAEEPVRWKRVKIDEVFRSEAATAFDVNCDGRIDVVHGEMWYEAPDWLRHEIRKPGNYVPATGYSQSFGNWGCDVNGDGWTDLICVGFPGAPCHWFENPRNGPGHWKQHEIWHSACNETPQFADITGDGRPELILSSRPEGQIGYLEIPAPADATKTWKFTPVCKKGTEVGTGRFYHGLGVGDFNGDGSPDLLIPDGWWEQPRRGWQCTWTCNAGDQKHSYWAFHPFTLPKPNPAKQYGVACADVFTDDLDFDGDNDLLLSSAHRTGVWWFENKGTNASPKFVGHVISEAFSQTHALHYVDINGDGTRDLVTGKRFYAHGPKGDDDPQGEVVMYWIEVRKGWCAPPQFIPHKIAEGSGTGIGTQFFVGDVNGDGLPDILTSNKKGTNLLLQTRRYLQAPVFVAAGNCCGDCSCCCPRRCRKRCRQE